MMCTIHTSALQCTKYKLGFSGFRTLIIYIITLRKKLNIFCISVTHIHGDFIIVVKITFL